jgi:hypothetical protein
LLLLVAVLVVAIPQVRQRREVVVVELVDFAQM